MRNITNQIWDDVRKGAWVQMFRFSLFREKNNLEEEILYLALAGNTDPILLVMIDQMKQRISK